LIGFFECDFERVDGYLFLPLGGSELMKELEAIHGAGLVAVE